MTAPAMHPRDREESEGFTLVELLVYIALAVIVLVIVGGFFINSITVEQSVRRANEGASSGQLASEAISQGVRGASDLSLTVPDAGTQLLSARSVGSGTTAQWRCQAWYFGAGEIRTKSSSGLIPAPTPTEALGWTLLAAGVSADGTHPVFAREGPRVDTSFSVSTGAGFPVLIETTAVSRQRPGTETERLQCFSS